MLAAGLIIHYKLYILYYTLPKSLKEQRVEGDAQIAEEQDTCQQTEGGDVVARGGEPCAVAELITPLGQGRTVAFAELVDAVTHA